MDNKVRISGLSGQGSGPDRPLLSSSLGCLWKDNYHVASIILTHRLCHDASPHQRKNWSVPVNPLQRVSLDKDELRKHWDGGGDEVRRAGNQETS